MSAFTGTGQLVRLGLRRDRILLPVWLLLFVAIAAGTAKSTIALYQGDIPSLVKASEAYNSTAAAVALNGRVYDPTAIGGLGLVKISGMGAVLLAVFAIILVVRHTRAEEETGRLELVGATVIGRYAALTATLIIVVGSFLVLALLTMGALVQVGLPGAGSVAFGLGWAGVGLAFAAIAAVAAQVTGSARTAIGIGSTVLGVTYVLRAAGDIATTDGTRWLRWLSPIGWEQQLRPYAGQRWWTLLIPLVFAGAVWAGAYALVARRDLGTGLVQPRPGRATATAALRGPFALAWRLQRGTLVAWAIGYALLGALLGSAASNIGDLLDNDQTRELVTKLGGEKGLADAFLAAELGLVGVIATAYGVQAAMRLRSEETSQRIEPVLSTGTSRLAWAASHILIALVGTTLLMLLVGLTAGAAYGNKIHDSGQITRLMAAGLVQLPAIWVVVGIVVAAFGLVPRYTVLGWAFLVGFLVIGELGPVMRLNQKVMDVSPYAHVPRLPGTVVHATPVVVLTVVAALLVVAGLVGFRRRDVVS